MGGALLGFREFYPEDCALRQYIFETFRSVASTFGFEEFDGPILEPLELFAEKSGPEIAEQLFHFEDRGGRSVAMRPEMTPTLARMVGARAAALRRPIRWFSVGEQFRYERPQKGRLRAFYQMNLDLLGESAIGADGEVIAALIASLKAFGLNEKDFRLRLSDRQLWRHFLASRGVSDDGAAGILNTIDKMGREPESVSREKLCSIVSTPVAEELLRSVKELSQCTTLGALGAFFRSNGHGAAMDRLREWEELFNILTAMELAQFISIDLSVVRGLAYYTGFVFEAFECGGESRALAGGGRYDNLVKKLAGTDMPACGFAIGDVTLGNLLREKNLLPRGVCNCDFWLAFDDVNKFIALRCANLIRQKGRSVLYSLVEHLSLTKQLKFADRAGARFAVLFGFQDETGCSGENLCVLKDMRTGNSRTISINSLLEECACLT
ncbi:MAG: histidine--tRNA ligase [Puniceicoccales bacterium]|jgi:histidyl-tRNA synthetase|nr:histidine--tRNA ligase [Puniceicoccales bacterium]